MSDVNLPRYRDLPVRPELPPHSAWSLFGDDDQIGTINLLTPERVKRAAQLIRSGRVFALNWDLELPDPPLLGRGALRHHVNNVGWATDDHYDNFYPQASTQLDALCHIGHPEYGFYNGHTAAEITGRAGSPNGIDHWARRGIAGRFVLADLERHRVRTERPLRQDESDAVGVDEIDAALAAEGVHLEPGDILLLRFGWIGWYEQQDQAVRAGLARRGFFPTPGLSQAERSAEWLWDHHVAAVLADCPSLEVMPVDPASAETFLHFRLIPLLGLAIGELFALDDLAADCASDGRYEGFLTAAPLNKLGGSGSTGNSLAIK